MIQKFLQHKYKLIIGIFLIWFAFIDSTNIFDLYALHKEKRNLLKDKKYYSEEIEKAKEERAHLFGNKKNLEKFAREQYLMKKEDEDIFIVMEDTESN